MEYIPYLVWTIILVTVILALWQFVYIFTLPNTFRVVREIVIKAPPEAAFRHVNNLRTWNDWSPWAKLDPQMKMTYGDKEVGTGAWYEWNGNDKVGEGKLTITDSRPSESLKIRLNFIRPFKADNDVDFTFKCEGDGTRVTWGMDGKNNFFLKVMSLIMSMDTMVGNDFEKGLNSLKLLAEDRSRS